MAVHTDDELKLASQYLVYHIRMLVETKVWLDNHPSHGGWETERNAILEAHLVHERVLIDFVSNTRPGARADDVVAVDYFHDKPHAFSTLNDKFLNDEADRIGGWLVHITKKPMPQLKSSQAWPVDAVCAILVVALERFFNTVPEIRLEVDVKAVSLQEIARLSPPKSFRSVSPST